jgi:hypothetical protein
MIKIFNKIVTKSMSEINETVTSKYLEMFPDKQIHFGDNDPDMLPKTIWLDQKHLAKSICDDSKFCALASAARDADYRYDEIKVGWLHTFIRKGDDVYVYKTPKYFDKTTGRNKSIAEEFDEAGGEFAKANNKVRPVRIPPGVYTFEPLWRRKRTREEIEQQKVRDRERTKSGGISVNSRDDKDGYKKSLRKLSIH